MVGAVPSELTVAAAYVVLFVAACCRGAMTYALGRVARHAGEASRLRRLFRRPVMLRTERVVQRFGAPAVSLSFLTVGVQSAVNASAGVLRMPLRFYLPGLAVGALLWAGVYLTVGMAMLSAWNADGLWWVPLALVAGALVVVATAVMRLRGREVADRSELAEQPGTVGVDLT
jgi:membrane protein DedA with SNARE-associated domain